MFLTGVRVGNLLKVQVRHAHQILEKNQFDLELIKKKRTTVQTFTIPVAAYSLFLEIKHYFELLIKNKADTAEIRRNRAQGSKKSLFNGKAK